MADYIYKDLCEEIIGGAIEVHRHLGPGLLENAYRVCLAYELRQRKLSVQTEVALPLQYKGVNLELGYRLDLVVENNVCLEIKALKSILPIHRAQILSYLRLANLKVGLLLNFHNTMMRDGIKRYVL